MKKITNNQEILYIYDATMTNPNGNPDLENMPRMDLDTDINYVSDLRLKRYIRDYAKSVKGQEIFVSKNIDEKTGKEISVKAEDKVKALNDVTDCYDVRLFGGVFPVSGNNFNLTGPVQFTWGKSLHKVICTDHAITTTFKTSDKGADSTGSMGRDKRVDYSLIAFRGRLNAITATRTNLTLEDVLMLDECMIRGLNATNTRSKIGQEVRMYIRVDLKDNNYLNDLRDYISFESDTEYPKSIKDGYLNITNLLQYLNDKKDKIDCINVYVNDMLDVRIDNKKVSFVEALKETNIEVNVLED